MSHSGRNLPHGTAAVGMLEGCYALLNMTAMLAGSLTPDRVTLVDSAELQDVLACHIGCVLVIQLL